MTSNEKRSYLVEKVLSREKKNKYSQDLDKRTLIESGYGDCSGTMWYWYYKLFNINIGANTEAQINSKKGVLVDLEIKDGIPDITKLKKGDLLYFRGSDSSRTKGVGHVEMYIGNSKLFGHGSGLGGTIKNLIDYCKMRYSQPSIPQLKNKGLICVKRFIEDDLSSISELTNINDIVWELAHRKIITNSDLWLSKLGDDENAYWLARKCLHFIREYEENKE